MTRRRKTKAKKIGICLLALMLTALIITAVAVVNHRMHETDEFLEYIDNRIETVLR